jgi:hypothetical protein
VFPVVQGTVTAQMTAAQMFNGGLTTQILVGGGASAFPVWTTATGTGAPVRATSPTIVSPTINGTVAFTSYTVSGVIGTAAAAPTIASATTIAPTQQIAFVSGTTAIATITPPAPIASGGGQITLIPTGAFTTTTAGNIAIATTAVVGKALVMTYDTTAAKWYPSYSDAASTTPAPTIASATTVAPTQYITFISGTTAINTITPPSSVSSGGGAIIFIPTGAFTTTTSGNIALASTAVPNKVLIMAYDSATAKWYPSY